MKDVQITTSTLLALANEEGNVHAAINLLRKAADAGEYVALLAREHDREPESVIKDWEIVITDGGIPRGAIWTYHDPEDVLRKFVSWGVQP